MFTTMAIIQIQHEKRLKNFGLNVKQVKLTMTGMRTESMRGDSRDVSREIIPEAENESDEEENEKFEQPWTFWKWLIPIYSSVFCVSWMLMISYFVTSATSSEFFIYVDDDLILYDFLAVLPTFVLLVEFPFNMIPFDWPQLIFAELLFTFYMLINFIALSC